jgi:hypothetical protein
MNPKKIISALFHTKLGKLLPILLLVGLIASASAAVFVMYYGAATATVRSPDVTLVNGGDISGSCSQYPCATSTLSSTNDFATIGVSLFASATSNPQPATYYTDLLHVHNGALTASHTINSITISNIAQSGSDLGSITVYYCTSQTNAPASSASCASFTFTSTTGGSLSGNSILPQTLAAGGNGYIEVVGNAASGATASDTVTFQVQISWT